MSGLLAEMAREAAKGSLGRMFLENAARAAGSAAGMLAVREVARMLRKKREPRPAVF